MKTRTMILCALFAALTAVGAFFKIPFALAAISLQFLFTAMAGVLLGAGYGALSQAVYVLLGLVGVPIFAQGGGFSYVLQPTFGFLLGLIPTAWVIGVLAKRPLKFWRTALAMDLTSRLSILRLRSSPTSMTETFRRSSSLASSIFSRKLSVYPAAFPACRMVTSVMEICLIMPS